MPKQSSPKAERGAHQRRGVLNSCVKTRIVWNHVAWDQLSLFGVAHPFHCALLGGSCLQPRPCACQCSSSALLQKLFWLFLDKPSASVVCHLVCPAPDRPVPSLLLHLSASHRVVMLKSSAVVQ